MSDPSVSYDSNETIEPDINISSENQDPGNLYFYGTKPYKISKTVKGYV